VGGHWGFALFACWLGAFAEIRALHTVKSSNESIECAECGCGEELARPSRWRRLYTRRRSSRVYLASKKNTRASYNGSIEASQASSS